MEKENLAALVQRAQSGDGQAMEALLRLAHTSVSYQCRKFMAHAEDAEDMTQEVLLKIYRGIGSLKEPEKFIGWANRIAARHCINERQRNPKDLQFTEDEEGHSFLEQLEELDEQKVPDAAIDNAETSRMIAELVDGLPDAQRMCTYLFYYDQMSVKEISEMVGVSENTIKSRLNYARKAIKDGVLGYEKKGIKLYGLSPLPFLLYFLRRAAESGADAAAASTMAEAVVAAGTAGGTAAAAVAGAVESAGTAGGAAEGAAAAAGGASAASGTATASGTTGIFSGMAAKVTAGIVAGAIAVGGIGLAVAGQKEDPPPADTPYIEETVEPSIEPTLGPVELAEYTLIRTTVETGLDNVVIYLETPQFEEVNEGYRKINELFAEIHAEFENRTEPNIAWILAHLDEVTPEHQIRYTEVYTVDSQDGETVKVNHEWEWTSYRGDTMEIRQKHWSVVPSAFDVRTGELLDKGLEGKREAFREFLLENYGTDSFEEVTRREDYGRDYFTIYYRHQFGYFGT